MSDIRILPIRADLDSWVCRMKHTRDLDGMDPTAVAIPAAVFQLPTHAAVTLAGDVIAPAWVSWGVGTVQVASAGSEPILCPWSLRSNGQIVASGTATLEYPEHGQPAMRNLPPKPAGYPTPTAREFFSTRTLRRYVENLAKDGMTAEFEAVEALTPYIRSTVRRKNVRVAAEIIHKDAPIQAAVNRPPVVLDSIGEESIITEITVGRVGQQSAAVSFRSLRQAIENDRLAKVPIVNYLRGRLDSAIETAIRRSICDPHVGRRIRREWPQWLASQEVRPTGVQGFVDYWNSEHPNGRIGEELVVSALTARHDAMVDHLSLDLETEEMRMRFARGVGIDGTEGSLRHVFGHSEESPEPAEKGEENTGERP